MQDIVPCNGGVQKAVKNVPKEKVLRLQYKLPARLRRPIRQELRKEKQLVRKQENRIDFERRPIITEQPARRPPSYSKNSGAEHHTGDVYMRSRPEVQVSAPPYISAIARSERVAGGKSPVMTSHRQPRKIVWQQRRTGNAVKKQARITAVGSKRQTNYDLAIAGVRDMPYQFGTAPAKTGTRRYDRQPGPQGSEPIIKRTDRPRDLAQTAANSDVTAGRERRDTIELLTRFSRGNKRVLNGSDDTGEEGRQDKTWSRRGIIQQPNRYLPISGQVISSGGRSIGEMFRTVFNKQVAVNAMILVVGCGLAYGVIWNLSGLGRGWQVMGSVQDRAAKAYGSLISASSALAETNFAASEAGFSDATRLIQEAQAELGGAMASSQNVLRWIDVTGTVRSGQEILSAGEQLSIAGKHLAQGANQLLRGQAGETFVTAVTGAKIEFAQAEEALAKAEKSLGQIDSVVLPPEISGQLTTMAESTQRIRAALKGFMERSDVVLSMLGAERDKQYLLVFQNNHEMRPTGGFIGSIGLVHIDRGAVEAIDINSVYDPDGQLKEFIEPPQPLKIVTNRWFLRDANWFVDYSASARKIIEFFEKEGGPTVDGVIALTPEVIRELLKVTGPIQVPGYEAEVNYDNFWLVTQDQVSYSYDKELNEPKKFLADLAPVLLNRLLSGNANSSMAALEGMMRMIEEKQFLVYLNNENWQTKLTKIGWSGDLPVDQAALLAVNNANIAGHKSDQFMEQEIDYRLEVMPDGTVEAVVMIKREHRGNVEQPDFEYPPDENPAQKDNVVYQRVLVPKGAKLLEADGFSSPADINQMVVPESFDHLKADEDVVDWQTGQWAHESGTVIGEEAGYTFFANWVVTKPGKTSVVFYRYRLAEMADWPSIIDPAGRFGAYVVKQPGDMRTTVRVQVDLPDGMHIIHTVPESGITQEGKRTLIYRGALRKDLMTGMVFAKTTD